MLRITTREDLYGLDPSDQLSTHMSRRKGRIATIDRNYILCHYYSSQAAVLSRQPIIGDNKMGYLFLASVLAIAFAVAFFWHRSLQRSLKGASRDPAAQLTLLGTFAAQFVIAGIFVVVTFFSMFQQVPTGNVGVIYAFNRIVGQTGDGAQFILPWEDLKPATIQVQGHKFDAAQLSSFSKESQVVDVAATLNISVSPTHIQQLYRTVGPDYFNVLVAPRVRQAFKDETVKYAAVEIAPHREDIRRDVKDRLIRELSAESIDVRDLLIDDIAFSQDFQGAIEAKQVRTQKALEEQAGIAVSEAQAKQLIAEETGKGQAALARAQAQAQANREIAASLTPLLVKQNLIDRLAPNAKVVVVPSGQGLILGSDTAQ